VTRWASAGGVGGDPAVAAAGEAAGDSAGGAGGAGGDPVVVAPERAAGDSACGCGGAGGDPVLVAAAEVAGDWQVEAARGCACGLGRGGRVGA